mmetsp:Transcript_12643/g.19227  ORF Transcript_12643/g.19227 Transcript_12643/m.19227 type:complete len:113 (-) Transcript_12643:968-1306(-)
MIIDAKTVAITLIVVAVGFSFGLQFIRSFALSIAQQNHDANIAMDTADEQSRLKRERDADTAAATAFKKVEPLLTESNLGSAPVGAKTAVSPPESTTGTNLAVPKSGQSETV